MSVTKAAAAKPSATTRAESTRPSKAANALATKLDGIDRKHKNGTVSLRFTNGTKHMTTKQALARIEQGEPVTVTAVRWTSYSRGKLVRTDYTAKVKVAGEKPLQNPTDVKAVASFLDEQIAAHTKK